LFVVARCCLRAHIHFVVLVPLLIVDCYVYVVGYSRYGCYVGTLLFVVCVVAVVVPVRLLFVYVRCSFHVYVIRLLLLLFPTVLRLVHPDFIVPLHSGSICWLLFVVVTFVTLFTFVTFVVVTVVHLLFGLLFVYCRFAFCCCWILLLLLIVVVVLWAVLVTFDVVVARCSRCGWLLPCVVGYV
jgi:hypothetical protein